LKVMRNGRPVTVEVTSDGAGLVSHAGSALLAQVADKLGLTSALSLRLEGIKQRRRGYDPGRVIRDVAVMLADGGECVSDLGGQRDQEALFGPVASDSTAFRVIDGVASTPGLLDAVRAAHARARARFWELHGTPKQLRVDVDATLITAHSEKEKAAGNYKGGYGFHPMKAYLDETREALGGVLRPGNAGSNTAADHKAVVDLALAQIPAEYIESLEILVRADSAGATHEFLDYCREGSMRFSVGYELTESVRAAILLIPKDAWIPALDQDGTVRENGEIAEITEHVDLSSWPERSRLIVRRERPHPGAQLSFTDHDGYRFQDVLCQAPIEIAAGGWLPSAARSALRAALWVTAAPAIRWVARMSGRGPDGSGTVTAMCCCRPVWRAGSYGVWDCQQRQMIRAHARPSVRSARGWRCPRARAAR
jgi:hypothetical protein